MLVRLASLVLVASSPPVLAQCQTGTLHSPDPGHKQYFGHVAVDGGFVAVGAPGEDGAASDAGAVFVFDRTTLQLLRTLYAGDAEADAGFGSAVAVSGDTVIVGAPYHGAERGAAYLFDLTTGQQTAKLTPSWSLAGDRFGYDVDVDGGVAIASSPRAGSDDRGAAFLFDVATGTETHHLAPLDPDGSARFGMSVAVDGDRAFVGSPMDGSESAYLFDVPTGAQVHKLDSPVSPWGRFGYSVDLDGGRALVGSPTAPGIGAHAFDVATGHLLQAYLPQRFGTHRVGWSVALEGPLVVLGAPYDPTDVHRGGSVHVFDADNGLERKVLTLESPAENDELGGVVALAGEALYAAALQRKDTFRHAGVVALFHLGGDYLGSNYCGPAVPNSTGEGGRIRAFGTSRADDNCLELLARKLPDKQFGYFLAGETQGFVQQPGDSQGNLYLGGKIGRFDTEIRSTGDIGAFALQLDLENWPHPLPPVVLPGDTWSFTAWYRDDNPGATSNFTDGISVTFQ